MHDALSNRGAVNYDPYTAEQQYEMQQVRVRFLSFFADDFHPSISDVPQFFIIFSCFVLAIRSPKYLIFGGIFSLVRMETH